MRQHRITVALASIAGGYLGAFIVLFPRAGEALNRRLLGG